MGENTETIQASLATLLSKFEAMDARMSHLSKQIETTQQHVDKIRVRQAEVGAAPAGSAITELGATSTSRPAPRLANLQPPLLGAPGEQAGGQEFLTAPVDPVADPVVVREPQAPLRRDYKPPREHVPEQRREFQPNRGHDQFIKPPKHNFPRFAGENTRLWLDLAVTCFEMYQVQPHQWVAKRLQLYIWRDMLRCGGKRSNATAGCGPGMILQPRLHWSLVKRSLNLT